MTREEKIALLVNELEDIRCDNFDADTDEDKTLKEAVRVIKALEQQTRWIPVSSESLPDIDEEVLVDDGFDIFVAWWADDGFEAGWHSFDENYSLNTPILAWMPLPKPYKGRK